MRRGHFEALRPICPLCRARSGRESPLVLATVAREAGGRVIEGVLHCADPACRMEYPIVDGMPLIVPNLRAYIADNAYHIIARHDLGEAVEGIVGDGLGPGTFFDATRQMLSTYAWDGYADLDPGEAALAKGEAPAARPGAAVRCLEAGLALIGAAPGAPVLDMGCATGRTTFALAERMGGLALGIDLSFSMLGLAQGVLDGGAVRYPRRRVGVVYDRREFAAELPGAERADFWVCDAMAPPFPAGTFALAVALNLLDCVPSPRDLLAETARLLGAGGHAVIATPYDWSPGSTPVTAWIGGHSQRGDDHGQGEPFVRRLLTPGAHPQSIDGLRFKAEAPAVPWQARMHDRSVVTYSSHVVVAEKA